MTVVVTDKASFASLSHVDVRAYLQAQGWNEEDRIGDKAIVLTRPSAHGEWEILLPLREDLGDYIARMADAVHVLSEVEQRAETAVLADLKMAGSDIIRVRATHDAEDGTLSVDAGVTLYTQARELLLSAACSVAAPRPLFGNRKPQSALDYLDKVRLGQSERGSYVVTLLSPVLPAFSASRQLALAPEFEDDPHERIVTRTLVRALNAAREAAVEAAATNSFDAFEKRVHQGVSANLCEALARLVEVGGAVDLGVTWAKVRPAHVDHGIKSRVDFGPTTGRVLLEAARQFRSREPLVDQELVGWVVRLNRPPEAEVGTAFLTVIVEGHQRSARLDRLPEPEYEVLIRANNERRLVSLDGDVHRVGRTYEIRNPRNIRLSCDDDGNATQ